MITLYKKFVSPVFVVFFGHACRFTPTCSEYMNEAVERYGILKGGFMGFKRIIKCNPLSKPGYDPVN